MNDIERAINFVFRDCYVVPGVSGWANQLYVNGQFSGNFRMGTQDMELLRTIRDYQFQGKCVMKSGNALIMQFNPYLVESAIDQTLSRNCYVVPGVSGWANQLYVNGQFSGNFNQNTEQMKLKANLADLLENGTCLGRSPEEIRLLRDPNLINDMASFQYRGCYVKLGVSGWANQLYVNNQFSGNFDQRSEAEQHKLQATIVDLILRGSCVYDPIRRR